LRRSLQCVAVEQAAIDRVVAGCGLGGKTHRVAVFRGDDVKQMADREPPFWRTGRGGRELIFSSNHLDTRTIGAIADELERFQPDVLRAYPSVLEALCRLLHATNRNLNIPVVVCSSEVLPPRTWALAQAALSCVVADYYGQAERVAFAYAYEPHEYRWLAGYGFVELLPIQSQEDSDSDLYEVVATNLWNLTMPLVRFRTGDLVRLKPGADPKQICNGDGTFGGVAGRSQDYVVSSTGARLLGIDHIFRGIDHILRAQVVQDGCTIVLRVTSDGSFNENDRARVLAKARTKLPPDMSVTVEVTSTLEKTRANKAPFVIRRNVPSLHGT
jgi:phenylacetate-CoA ligase